MLGYCSVCMMVEEGVDYPSIVKTYRRRYSKMASSTYKGKLLAYAKSVLADPTVNLDWRELLDWEHRHLKYTKGKLPQRRAELPIDIIMQKEGRCGEFALLYSGLLLANGYDTRLIVDCSTLHDKSKKVAGDHVWVEVLADNVWIHVDPTERVIDKPLMYARDWSKDVNKVFAISKKEIVEVTQKYSPTFQR